MKKLLNSLKVITFTALIIMICGASNSASMESIEGIWYGLLNVGPDKDLRVAVIISNNPDEKVSAIFRIIDSGDVNFDVVTIEDNIITLRVTEGEFEIKGKIDIENESIDAEFFQYDTKIPLLLKRVDVLPESNDF